MKDIRYDKKGNWIDLSNVPHLNGDSNKLNWKQINDEVISAPFNYDDISGVINFSNYQHESRSISSDYNGIHIESTKVDVVRRVGIGFIVGKYSKDYIYPNNYNIKTKYGTVTVLEQITLYNGTHNVRGYKLKCNKCNNIFEITESHLKRSLNSKNLPIICPVCSGHKVKKGYNDLWTNRKDVAELLADPEDGFKYSAFSNQKVDFICPYCSSIKSAIIYNVSTKGLYCPKCNRVNSYPNRFMYNLLKILDIEFISECAFEWGKGYLYDFYLPLYKIIIEMHGIQHYEYIPFFHNNKNKIKSLAQQQEIDAIKKNVAVSNGITNYIVVDCKISDFDYIYNNILNTSLFNILNKIKLNDIELKKELQHSIATPILYKAAKLWNDGVYDAEILRLELGIKRSEVQNIMWKATETGLCTYDPSLTQSIGHQKTIDIQRRKHGKPIIELETGNRYQSLTVAAEVIKQFDGTSDATTLKKAIENNNLYHNKHYAYITQEEFNDYLINYPDKTYGKPYNLSIKLDEV